MFISGMDGVSWLLDSLVHDKSAFLTPLMFISQTSILKTLATQGQSLLGHRRFHLLRVGLGCINMLDCLPTVELFVRSILMQLVKIIYCFLASLSQQICLHGGFAVLPQDLLLRMSHAPSAIHICCISLLLLFKCLNLSYLLLKGKSVLVWLT